MRYVSEPYAGPFSYGLGLGWYRPRFGWGSVGPSAAARSPSKNVAFVERRVPGTPVSIPSPMTVKIFGEVLSICWNGGK